MNLTVDHFVGPQPSIQAAKKKPRGYNEEIAEEICERVGNGEKLHEVCKDPQMPGASTVYRWRAEHPTFDKMYECALMARFDLRCDELEEIAADGSDDYELIPGNSEDDVPKVKPKPETLGRSKLRIETIKWRMAKELPRKYGEPQLQAPVAAAPAQPTEPAPQQGNVVSIREAMAASTRMAAAK